MPDPHAPRPAHEVLTRDQMRRYARHIALREVGGAGQLRLLGAEVHLVGTGPAAEEAARYLAAAGVGRLVVEPALAARLGDELAALNPDCQVGAPPSHPLDGEGGETTVQAGPFEPDDRLEGCLGALAIMNHIVGVGAAAQTSSPSGAFRWETPRP